ncbi:MAG: DUF2628 domain-containing protein [Devosia sp.]
MTLYSIFEKVDQKQSAALGPLAVPERFSFFAAFLPPLYALRHGLALMLLAWAVLTGALIYLNPIIGGDACLALYLLVAVLFGFEATGLRREALGARGWVWRGDVVAAGEDLAERDYLSRR